MKRVYLIVCCLAVIFVFTYFSKFASSFRRISSLKHQTPNDVDQTVRTPTPYYNAVRNHNTVALQRFTKKPTNKEFCEPRKNIFFMKTHKTGSTTMQNILLRYAWAKDLIVGLPLHSNNFDYANRKKFDRSMVQPIAPGRSINILTHHMIFSQSGVSSVLPKGAFFFTFLRDPATHFESVYKYFKTVVVPFKQTKSLEEFIATPDKFFANSARLTFSWFAKNGMTFDLGFDNLDQDDTKIKAIVKKMDEMFKLVLISEYFDISLLLLREKLCWRMQDIAYLSVNARKTSTVPIANRDISQKVRGWNKIDTRLYNYYNRTFWLRVKKYGTKRLKSDLKELNKLKNELRSFCVEEGLFVNKDITDLKYKMYNPPGVEMTQYHLTKKGQHNETCIQLILPEIPWWRKMSDHQRESINSL